MSSIFITDQDPRECADILSDQHLRSQLGITARTLVAALREHGITGPMLPTTKAESPFSQWAAKDWDNFMWLSFHGIALAEEYYRRFDAVPSTSAPVLVAGQIGHLMSGGVFDFPMNWPWSDAARRHAKTGNVFSANQKALRDKYETGCEEGEMPTWTNAYPPSWLSESGQLLFWTDDLPS